MPRAPPRRLKLVVPTTPADAKGLLKTAIRDDDPVVFLEHKLLYSTAGAVPPGEHLVPFGECAIRRRGRDATVVAVQTMLLKSLQVAERLADEGIELEIVDPRTLVPLDVASIVDSVRRTHRLLVCHEAVERCGWAAEVAMQVMEHAFDELDAPIVRVCGAPLPVPYSSTLEEVVLPGEADILEGVRALLGGTGRARTRRPAARAVVELLEPASTAVPAATVAAAPADREFLMPRLSDTMVEGTIGHWLRRPGETVRRGDPLVEIETDKATMVVEAECDCELAEILVAEGDSAAVGAAIALVEPRQS